MTIPGGGVQQYGSSPPPLDSVAQQTLAAARARMEPPRPQVPALSGPERAEAEAAAKEREAVCVFCIGMHPLPNGPGCPRIASFELDGDGRVRSAAFWPGKRWAKGRVNFVEDAFEGGSVEEEAGDGSH